MHVQRRLAGVFPCNTWTQHTRPNTIGEQSLGSHSFAPVFQVRQRTLNVDVPCLETYLTDQAICRVLEQDKHTIRRTVLKPVYQIVRISKLFVFFVFDQTLHGIFSFTNVLICYENNVNRWKRDKRNTVEFAGWGGNYPNPSKLVLFRWIKKTRLTWPLNSVYASSYFFFI